MFVSKPKGRMKIYLLEVARKPDASFESLRNGQAIVKSYAYASMDDVRYAAWVEHTDVYNLAKHRSVEKKMNKNN